MRRLLVIVAIAGLLWAGYWFAVSRGVEGGLRAWFAERATEGWVADYASLTTDGFPAYFETVLTDVALADPTTGVAWTAPRFAIEAQAFRPNRITARWPDRQTIASPWERIDVTAERFDASVEFVPGTSLELGAIEAHLAELALASTNRWNLRIGTGRLVAAAMDEAAHAYAVSFEASDLVPSQRLRRDLDPARLLPEEIDGMTIEAHARFDAPWDRFALERARPQITGLDLRDLRAKWGALELRASGELAVGPDGVPDGRINVRATNWREILTLAGNAGLFPEPLLPTIERAFEILASLSGRPDTLDAPLTFRNGVVSFGPIPLGSAPRLAIR